MEKQMARIKHLFFERLQQFSLPLQNDNTFRADNWVLTFPLNFLKLPQDQELLLWHIMYAMHILAEDKILDDSGIEDVKKCYQHSIHYSKSCVAYSSQSYLLAKTHTFPTAFFDYEKRYYEALFFEKSITTLIREDYSQKELENCFKHKILPLLTSYAIWSANTVKKPIDQEVVEGVMHYHIAHQILDDIIDFKEDLNRPDLSAFIKLIKGEVPNFDMLNPLTHQNRIVELAQGTLTIAFKNLDKTEQYFEKKPFPIFISHLKKFRLKLEDTVKRLANEKNKH